MCAPEARTRDQFARHFREASGSGGEFAGTARFGRLGVLGKVNTSETADASECGCTLERVSEITPEHSVQNLVGDDSNLVGPGWRR